MKKILLLTILLVVAASAAITFNPAPPSKVGEGVTAFIPLSNYLLYVVKGGDNETWVTPTSSTSSSPTIVITHPGTGLILRAVGATTEESAPFDVVIGDEVRWQIIAEGETGVEGDATEPDGKSGTASVIAGDEYTFGINLCDVWYNVTTPGPTTGYTIDSDDQYDVINGASVQLRSEGTHAVWVSGGSYTPDTSFVTVEAGDATRLLLVCGGEEREPGDTASAGGKTGPPNKAFLEQDYEIDVYAVDDAWNLDTDYDGGVVTIFDGDDNVIGTSDEPISSGYVKVTVRFTKVNNSEYTHASETGGLTTSYDTPIDVDPAITSVEAVIDPSTTNPGVLVTLSATAREGSIPAPGATLYNTCLGLGTGSCSNLTLPDSMRTDDNGYAMCQVSASDTGTYYIEVTGGSVSDTVMLTIEELEGLVVQPNPFKNSMHTLPIDFRYKVEQIGVGGASEVYLLIADPFGNTVYTATYDINDVQTNPGEQTIQWNGANSSGNTVASGMYQAVVKITLINGSTSVIKKNFMLIW